MITKAAPQMIVTRTSAAIAVVGSFCFTTPRYRQKRRSETGTPPPQ
jgi:hypothetical protein